MARQRREFQLFYDPLFVTKQQRKNAEEALNKMWPSVPPKNVVPRLGAWRYDVNGERIIKKNVPTCKTIACFGGWCAWWPNFREQGVRQEADGSPRMLSQYPFPYDVAHALFGFSDLFHARHSHERGTDHEVVTKRLQFLIEHSKVRGSGD